MSAYKPYVMPEYAERKHMNQGLTGAGSVLLLAFSAPRVVAEGKTIKRGSPQIIRSSSQTVNWRSGGRHANKQIMKALPQFRRPELLSAFAVTASLAIGGKVFLYIILVLRFYSAIYYAES